jgi:hypothetical protein
VGKPFPQMAQESQRPTRRPDRRDRPERMAIYPGQRYGFAGIPSVLSLNIRTPLFNVAS